jgi:hypothetical protein
LIPESNKIEIQNLKTNEIILLRSYMGNHTTGYIIFLPVSSTSKPTKKQAVLLAGLSYSNRETSIVLIREGLMVSWELDYQVAFAPDADPLFYESGFEKNSRNFFQKNENAHPVLTSEISWDGMKSISNDLIYPLKITI